MRLMKTFYLLVATLIVFGLSANAVDFSRAILLDVPDEVAARQFGKMPVSKLSPEDSASIASYRFTGDTIKVLRAGGTDVVVTKTEE